MAETATSASPVAARARGSGIGPRRARRRLATRVFLALWVAFGVALIVLRAGEPGLHTGWTWNDAHILTASEWFKEHGFRGTLGLPPRFTAPKADGTWELYNTFPPGVFWLHELRVALGVESLAAHRACSVVWNHLAVLLLFVLVRRWTASAALAAVAASLYMFSGPYVTGAGGLWEHAPMLSLLGTLVAWTGFERARGPRRVRVRAMWLTAAVAMYVLDNLLTVQHAAMIGVLVGGRGLWWLVRGWRASGWRLPRHSRAVLAGVMVMGLVPPAVMAGRVAMQVQVMGGWQPAIDYFTKRAEQRAGLASESEEELSDVWRVLAMRAGIPVGREITDIRTLQGRYPALAPIALVGGGTLLIAALSMRGRAAMAPVRRGVKLGGALLAASMTWVLLFPQHVIIHSFVTIMFMPGLAVLSASAVIAPWAMRGATRESDLPRRQWAWPLLIVASAMVAWPTLESMKRSTALNAWARMDDHVRLALRDRKERERLLRKGASVLASAPMLELVGGPPVAINLGRPYRGLIERRDGAAREPDSRSVLVVSTRERAAQNLMTRQTRLRGLPRFFADPTRVAVFGAPGVAISTPLIVEPGESDVPSARWMHAALEPTLDGEALMWAVAVRHEREGLFAPDGGTMALTIHRSADADPVSRTVPLNGTAARGKRWLVAWMQLRPADAEAWDRIDVAITAPSGEVIRATVRRGPPAR